MKKNVRPITRPRRMVTLDPGTLAAAMRVGKKQKPPLVVVSRLIDAALAEWTEKRR